jgi:hypothetical protein
MARKACWLVARTIGLACGALLATTHSTPRADAACFNCKVSCWYDPARNETLCDKSCVPVIGSQGNSGCTGACVMSGTGCTS